MNSVKAVLHYYSVVAVECNIIEFLFCNDTCVELTTRVLINYTGGRL